MASVRSALGELIEAHDPYPALVVDRQWNLVMANGGAMALVTGAAEHLLEPPLNVYRVTLHPDGMAPRIDNLDEWAHHLLATLHRQVAVTRSPELRELLDEVSAYPTVADLDRLVAEPGRRCPRSWCRCACASRTAPAWRSCSRGSRRTPRSARRSTSPSTSSTSSCSIRPTKRRHGHGRRPSPLSEGARTLEVVATIDDVRPLALSLERSYEVFVRDRVKFRVGQIVYVAFSRDESIMGFGFPKEERAALVGGDPGKFMLPRQTDMRFNWVLGQARRARSGRGP